MHVALVGVDGCFTSALTVFIDVLGTAEVLRPAFDSSIPPIRIDVVGARRKVVTGAGLTVPVTMSLTDLDCFDTIVIPALGTLNEHDTTEALKGRDVRAVTRALGRIDHGAASIAAACTGVFALAETGLLDQHQATTSWWLGNAFRGRYPTVTLDLDAMVVSDDGKMTAGAAFAHLDLALAIVRRVSPALAQHVARMLVIDERPSQRGYLVLDHLAHSDALVLEFEQHVRVNLHEPLDLQDVAAVLGTSRRTLERRTQTVLGMSPIDFVQRLRVERATHLADTTDQSVEQIARQVGYANASTLRTLLRRAH